MNRWKKNQKIIWLLKALLFSYVVTGISLLLLSVLLYKFEWNEHLVSAAIVAVYVLSTVVGGIVIGSWSEPDAFSGDSFWEIYILFCFWSLRSYCIVRFPEMGLIC